MARFYERGYEPSVKLFHYRPGQALRVQGHGGCQNFWTVGTWIW